MMTEPDWDFLLETAMLHHTFWADGRMELASELRLRAAKFGATPEDRARLHVDVGSHGVGSTNAVVSQIDEERRNRVSRLLEDEIE